MASCEGDSKALRMAEVIEIIDSSEDEATAAQVAAAATGNSTTATNSSRVGVGGGGGSGGAGGGGGDGHIVIIDSDDDSEQSDKGAPLPRGRHRSDNRKVPTREPQTTKAWRPPNKTRHSKTIVNPPPSSTPRPRGAHRRLQEIW